jgi:glycosyltransferase involved in cell wall biosynthesis
LFDPSDKSRFGGAELQLYYMARELAKDKEFDVHFVVGDFSQPDREKRDGVALYKFFRPKGRLKYFRAIFGVFTLLKLLKNINADVHVQKAAGLESGVVALFCKLAGKKFIYMVGHNLAKERKNNYGMSFLRWWIFKMILAWADLIVAQHEDQKNALKEFFHKESIVRNPAQIIPQNMPSSAERKYTIWVGRCDDWKRPEVFIDLADKFSDEKFIMVCPPAGNAVLFNDTKDRASKLRNIEFFDYIPSNKIGEYFSKAKLLVMTSVSEGFPNVFIEAAKFATPILSLNVNPGKMLEKNNIGKCANGDEKLMGEYFEEMMQNKEFLEVLSQNAYSYAKNNHDLGKIIEIDKRIILKVAAS